MSITMRTSWKKTPIQITVSFSVSPRPWSRIRSGMKAEAGM
jgi:hypothetical protein